MINRTAKINPTKEKLIIHEGKKSTEGINIIIPIIKFTKADIIYFIY